MTSRVRIAAIAVSVALALLAGCAATPTQESTGQYVDDSAITAKVKAAIFNDPTLKSDEIKVETFKGQVQLSGFVRSWDNIAQAVALARGIGGVNAVRNDMQLK